MEFLILIFDFITSAVVSLFNILVRYGLKFLWYLLIFFTFIAVIRYLRTLKARRKFVKAITLSAEENGAEFKALRSPYLSVFFNLEGYDAVLTVRGTDYRIKYYPGTPIKSVYHLKDAHVAIKQFKFLASLRSNNTNPKGIKKTLRFDNSKQDGTVNIIAFAHMPHAVTEPFSMKEIYERDMENGRIFDGVYIYACPTLEKQLIRLMEGYTDTLYAVSLDRNTFTDQ